MCPQTAWGGRFPCKEDSQQGCLLGGSSIGRAVDFGSTDSRFDSEPPRHSGIDQLADRLALTQQVPGSIPGPGTILLCGRRSTGQDTALRTQRREGSNPSARTIFGLSFNWTGHIPPKDAIRVRIPAGRPFLWVTGTARPVHVAVGAID